MRKSTALSEKQRAFLQTIEDLPEYMPGRPSCLYFGNIPEEIWFTFRTENAVRKWVRNLAHRGLIQIQNDFFYAITDSGRSAIGARATSAPANERVFDGQKSRHL